MWGGTHEQGVLRLVSVVYVGFCSSMTSSRLLVRIGSGPPPKYSCCLSWAFTKRAADRPVSSETAMRRLGRRWVNGARLRRRRFYKGGGGALGRRRKEEEGQGGCTQAHMAHT